MVATNSPSIPNSPRTSARTTSPTRGPRRCSRQRLARVSISRFSRGRIFIAGDAAHLFTPTGGLGYNTAAEDAVNLGWKLAALIKGWGGPALAASYETERQAIALRNTRYARGFADSVG